MARTSSDSIFEKGKYNRLHKQTAGGFKAYGRGEKPMSRWTKKDLVSSILSIISSMPLSEEHSAEIKRFIRKCNVPLLDVMDTIKTINFDYLKHHFLEIKGHHYTGNFYMCTLFYGVKEGKDLIRELSKVITPLETTQLQLFPVSDYTVPLVDKYNKVC